MSLQQITQDVIGAVARGWTHDKNSSKEFDTELAEAIVEEVSSLITKAYEQGIDLILNNIQTKLEEERSQTAYNKNMHLRTILGGLEDEILKIKANIL